MDSVLCVLCAGARTICCRIRTRMHSFDALPPFSPPLSAPRYLHLHIHNSLWFAAFILFIITIFSRLCRCRSSCVVHLITLAAQLTVFSDAHACANGWRSEAYLIYPLLVHIHNAVIHCCIRAQPDLCSTGQRQVKKQKHMYALKQWIGVWLHRNRGNRERTRNSHGISIVWSNDEGMASRMSVSAARPHKINFQEATMFSHHLSHSHFPPHSFWPNARSLLTLCLSHFLVCVCVCCGFVFFASIFHMLRRECDLIDSFLFCDYVSVLSFWCAVVLHGTACATGLNAATYEISFFIYIYFALRATDSFLAFQDIFVCAAHAQEVVDDGTRAEIEDREYYVCLRCETRFECGGC